jgi:inorganic pyrophosphatase
MDINKISPGVAPPTEINVLIEITAGSPPVKYELDKESGALFVDRFLQVAMTYPCNYGFIPNTLSGDGDPCDVLVICDMPLVPMCVVPARPIGVLLMEDESGSDEKILAVPTTKAHLQYASILSVDDLPRVTLDKISHFFEHYKKLEPNKWVKVQGWAGIEQAKKLITAAIQRNNESN